MASTKQDTDTKNFAFNSSINSSPLVPASGLRDQNQNPEIKNANIFKNAGNCNTTTPKWPFQKPLICQASTTEPYYYDKVDDYVVGKTSSYLRFTNHVTDYGSITHFDKMLLYSVNELDQYGNVEDSASYRGVSFLRPRYVKDKNAAFTVVSGTHQWVRETKIKKSGSGEEVSPMSNSKEQVDFELIGGQEYIHNEGGSSGTGPMQLTGNPVKVQIAKKPPTRTLYSVYG